MIESSDAWVIHHYPVRDHLLLVYVLTPSRYFKAFYRLPKKTGHAKPQPFCPYWISWKEGRDAINIQSFESRAPAYWFKDLKLFVSLYINELLFNLIRADTVEQLSVYPYYEALLAHPEDCPELLLRQFEWQLLADCGYAIDFSVTCQQEPISACKHYQFHPGQGFTESLDGILGQHLIDIATHAFTPECFLIFKKVLRQTILFILDGKPLNSRILLTQWLKQKNQGL